MTSLKSRSFDWRMVQRSWWFTMHSRPLLKRNPNHLLDWIDKLSGMGIISWGIHKAYKNTAVVVPSTYSIYLYRTSWSGSSILRITLPEILKIAILNWRRKAAIANIRQFEHLFRLLENGQKTSFITTITYWITDFKKRITFPLHYYHDK